MVTASGRVTQVASNNVGGTQAHPPINVGTSPATVGFLHHMGAAVISSQYSFQTSLYVNITRILFLILNSISSFMTHRRPII